MTSSREPIDNFSAGPECRRSERGVKLLVLCPFPEGVAAGQRLKYEQYFDTWREEGYDITVSPYMDLALWDVVYKKGHLGAKVLGAMRGQLRRLRDLFRIARYDLVYVFMWVTPIGTPLFERVTRRLAKRLIVDVEDNVLVSQSLATEHNPNWLLSFLKGRGKAPYLIETADHVVTSSPFLNDTCLQLNLKRQCTYVTSSVDTDRYIVHGTRDSAAPVTLGWTGTFSSRPYLDLLRSALQQLARRRRFRLVVIGNFDYELEGVELEVIRWTKEREIADLQKFDIGLYPLPTNDWVLGKSGLKAIQYMAMGIPTVATRVGTTPMVLDEGVTGLLVESEAEWIAALERLIDDPSLRSRMGAKARIAAQDKYSVRAVKALYLSILDDTVGCARAVQPAASAARQAQRG